jgi:TatD DNase family protein
MIDSHCHLDHEPLSTNLKEVISRSKAIGINKLLTICTTINSYENILKIVEIDPIIYGTFGIHPHETDNDKVSKNEIVKKIKLNKKIIGVGETGLDFHYNNSDKESQLMSFKKHIEASIELNIPLIIHSRNAESETYNVLHEFKKDNLKILMHCFTGSSDFSKKMLSLGAYISLSGIITFNKSKELQKTASSIPIDRLLIETDSPYLAPIPKRGSTN